MITSPTGAWRCVGRVTQALGSGEWARHLALLAVALGLVLMHHVVGAHQHSPSDPIPPTTSAHAAHGGGSSSPTADVPLQGAAGPAAEPDLDGARTTVEVASPTALLHNHPDPNGHDPLGALLHMCLAALVAAAVLALTLALVVVSWRPARVTGTSALLSGGPAAHPPPVPSRLAQLQVLRL